MTSKRGIENDLEDLTEDVLHDLGPRDRVQHLIEANAMEDRDWRERLWETTPEKTYRQRDAAVVDTMHRVRALAFDVAAHLLDMGWRFMVFLPYHQLVERMTRIAVHTGELPAPSTDLSLESLYSAWDIPENPVMAAAACPYCGAEIGEPCRTASGDRAEDPHKDRREKVGIRLRSRAGHLEAAIAREAEDAAATFLAWWEAWERFAQDRLGVDLGTWLASLGGPNWPPWTRLQGFKDLAEGADLSEEDALKVAENVRESLAREGEEVHPAWEERPVEMAHAFAGPVGMGRATVEGERLPVPEASDRLHEEICNTFAVEDLDPWGILPADDLET